MNWLSKLLRKSDPQDEYMSLTALEEQTGIRAGTLRMAIFCKRLPAKKSGHVWLSNVRAVEQAIKSNKLRRP